jgi:hypothetical protein
MTSLMISLMTSLLRYYKVLMASNKRGAGSITFNLETRITPCQNFSAIVSKPK